MAGPGAATRRAARVVTSEEAQKHFAWKAERRRKRRAWWTRLGRGRQAVLVVVVAVVVVGFIGGIVWENRSTPSNDPATVKACGSYWTEARNLLGGGYSASGLSGSEGNATIRTDLALLAVQAAEAIPPVRDGAVAMEHTARLAMAPGAGKTEFLAFTHAIGDMAGACTDAGHPAPKP